MSAKKLIESPDVQPANPLRMGTHDVTPVTAQPGGPSMFGLKKEAEKTSQMTAEEVYSMVRSAFDKAELKYGVIPENKIIQTTFMGDDLPIKMNIIVDDMVIRFVCLLDFRAASENFREVAWQLNCINKELVFGGFYLDPEDGFVMFEDAFPYKEAKVSEEFILAFSKLMGQTVDKYDGDLKKIAEKVQRPFDDAMYG